MHFYCFLHASLQLSLPLWEWMQHQLFFKQFFFFPQLSPTVSSGMSWAANQPTPVETHPKLHSWGRCDWDMKQVVCAAPLLLSEVPITQGQAEARGKPSHSVGVQLWEQPVSVTSKTTGKKYKNKFSSSQSLPRGKKLFPIIPKEDSPFIVFPTTLNQRHTTPLKFLYWLAVFDDTSLLALPHAFIPSVPHRRLVGVVFPGNRSKAELFWATFLLQNLCVFTNVAVTPTEARKQLLPHGLQGRNRTAPAGDVLLEWVKACRRPGRQAGDVPEASPHG